MSRKKKAAAPAVEPVEAVEAAPVIEAQPPQDNAPVAEGSDQITELYDGFLIASGAMEPYLATPHAPHEWPATVEPVAAVEPLADYLARIELAAQPLAVCQVTHPDAKDGAIHQGTFAGIRLVRGEKAAALLSSGETI